MRIGQIIVNLSIGGVERLAVDLACAQKSSGHNSTIYCVESAGYLEAEARAAGVACAILNKGRGFSVKTIYSLVQFMVRDRLDVVHTHFAEIHHYGVLAARLASVPVVVNTLHAPPHPAFTRRLKYLYGLMMPLTNAVVLVSENLRELYLKERLLPQGKTRVIHSGVPLAGYIPYKASPGSFRPKIRYGTLGRMVPEKDHATLLSAFQELVARVPEAELHIAGDGPLRCQTQELAADLGLKERVHFHGVVPHVAAYLSSLDIFVLSSKSEGLPVAVLEAMAVGLPIISTDVGGVREVLPEGDVARFCVTSNAHALAEAMSQFAHDSSLILKGNTARRIVREQLSVNNTWDKYEALFRELLKKNSSRFV